MPPQEMPDGQGRMIESAEVAHPQPPHHPLRTKVHRRRKGVHPRQSQPAEGIVQHGPRRFGGIALPPDLGDEPPSDLDTGCKRRLEGRTVQPRQPDQPSVPASFDGIQSPTGLRPFGDDPIEKSVRLRPRQRVRKNSITLRSAFIAASGSLSSGSHSLSRNRSVSKRYTMFKSAKGTGTVFVPPRVPNYFTYNR